MGVDVDYNSTQLILETLKFEKDTYDKMFIENKRYLAEILERQLIGQTFHSRFMGELQGEHEHVKGFDFLFKTIKKD
jgi:hypothetical protein